MWADCFFPTISYGLSLEMDSMGQRSLLVTCGWLVTWGLGGGFSEAKKLYLQALRDFWIWSGSRTSQQSSIEELKVFAE